MRHEPDPPHGESLDAFTTALLERCTFPPPGTAVVCALSGGPDSAALVALAVAAQCDVEAVHIDHALRDSSIVDAAAAERIARYLGVSFRCERVEVGDGPNLEARARAARQSVLGPDAMTGHTSDDQAETTLLALLRGSGATGLSAMTPGVTKPLLGLRRSETNELCAHMKLDVATDPSNTDARFRRNRVRNELLPLIDDIAGRDVSRLITRASDLLRDDDELLEALATKIDPTDAVALTQSPRPLARRAVRRWLEVDGYPPDAAAVERVLAVAAGDAVGCEVSGNLQVKRSQQRLKLFSGR